LQRLFDERTALSTVRAANLFPPEKQRGNMPVATTGPVPINTSLLWAAHTGFTYGNVNTNAGDLWSGDLWSDWTGTFPKA
jgi:hypothetical protein